MPQKKTFQKILLSNFEVTIILWLRSVELGRAFGVWLLTNSFELDMKLFIAFIYERKGEGLVVGHKTLF